MNLVRDRLSLVSLIFLVALISLTFCSTVTAQTYGKGSNIAGTWQMTLTPGTHLVSFPLLPEDKSLDNVLGDQLPGGASWDEATRIITYLNDETIGSYYSSNDNEWIGTLDELDLKRGYWLIIPQNAMPANIRLVGAAMDADTMDMGMITPGMNIVSAGFPFSSTLSSSGLVTSGHSSASNRVTSDRVYKWEAGTFDPSWHDPNNGWQGNWQNLNPGIGYVVVVVNPNGGFHWRMPRPDEVQSNMMSGNQNKNQGYHTIPTPDFSTPPWGGASAPKSKKRTR